MPQDMEPRTTGGFNFELCNRNAFLDSKGYEAPGTRKTGTTICGVLFKDGVVLAADTRATEGSIVCDKNCEKIHYIAPNIWCCGAGTSADTENSTGLISSQLKLHCLATGRQARVVTSLTMLSQMLFKYQGHVSAALVLGGVDVTGAHLHTVYPHGSTDSLPYVSMGSGSLAAMAVLEAGFKKDLSKEEAMALLTDAIRSGIFNDLGSGSNVDLCVITKEGHEMHRNHQTPNPRGYRKPGGYVFPRGYTQVRKEQPAEGEAADAMDTS